MLEKSLEDIIKNKHILVHGQCDTDIFAIVPVKELAQTIKDYYLAKLPKKKNQQPDGTYLNYGTADIFNNGYNQAIDDMNKAIEAE